MTIDFFRNFYKKDNSTKQPEIGGAGNLTEKETVTGVLKEPCSIMNPVINLQKSPNISYSPDSYRYAYIPLFSRYYWVKDWMWNDGLWTVRLSEDILATYKNDIGDETEYILRTDSTTDFNTDITDIAYPATTNVETTSYAISNCFSTTLEDGIYIVGIISGASAMAVGAISYFAMTHTEFGALKNKLFSDDNLEIMGIIDSSGQALVTDLSQEILKTLYNPYQYIVSCMWFPFTKSAITNKTPQTGIKIGWWEYPSLTGDLLYAQTIEIGNETFGLHAHPQSATRGNYLNFSPYTKRTLIGRFGIVALDNSCFRTKNIVNISYKIDLITGQCYSKISAKDSNNNEDLLTERNFLLGVPIQLAQVGTDYLGTAVHAINTVGGTLNGVASGAVGGIAGSILGGVSGALNGIYNTLSSAMPQVETSGLNGSFLSPINQTHIIEQFYKIVDEDIHHRGRPLCELRKINTLSGFILCAEGDIDLNCYDDERAAIKHFLTNGFYYE